MKILLAASLLLGACGGIIDPNDLNTSDARAADAPDDASVAEDAADAAVAPAPDASDWCNDRCRSACVLKLYGCCPTRGAMTCLGGASVICNADNRWVPDYADAACL